MKNYEVMCVRVPGPMASKLKRLGDEMDCTASELMRYAIRDLFDHLEEEPYRKLVQEFMDRR